MELPGPTPCLVFCFHSHFFFFFFFLFFFISSFTSVSLIAGRTPTETLNPGAGVMVRGKEVVRMVGGGE